jgi:hypothetical protein
VIEPVRVIELVEITGTGLDGLDHPGLDGLDHPGLDGLDHPRRC